MSRRPRPAVIVLTLVLTLIPVLLLLNWLAPGAGSVPTPTARPAAAGTPGALATLPRPAGTATGAAATAGAAASATVAPTPAPTPTAIPLRTPERYTGYATDSALRCGVPLPERFAPAGGGRWVAGGGAAEFRLAGAALPVGEAPEARAARLVDGLGLRALPGYVEEHPPLPGSFSTVAAWRFRAAPRESGGPARIGLVTLRMEGTEGCAVATLVDETRTEEYRDPLKSVTQELGILRDPRYPAGGTPVR